MKSPRRSRAGDLDGRGVDDPAAVHAVQHRDVLDSVGGVTERPWSLRMLLIETKRVDRSGVILSNALSRRYLDRAEVDAWIDEQLAPIGS